MRVRVLSMRGVGAASPFSPTESSSDGTLGICLDVCPLHGGQETIPAWTIQKAGVGWAAASGWEPGSALSGGGRAGPPVSQGRRSGYFLGQTQAAQAVVDRVRRSPTEGQADPQGKFQTLVEDAECASVCVGSAENPPNAWMRKRAAHALQAWGPHDDVSG